MVQKVVGLLGLPRSGTTMLSSVLAVHPQIEAVYEPWNRDDDGAPDEIGFADFVGRFAPAAIGKELLLVKETTTHLTYLDNMARFLASVPTAIGRDLILLWRDPLHVFLSEIEARKKWWDDADASISEEEFDRWADPRMGGLARMAEIGRQANALVVFYDALVADKERHVRALMTALGLEFDPRQLHYEQYLDKERVRGDVTIATDPAPVSDIYVWRRMRQMPSLRKRIAGSAWYPRVAAVSDAMAALAGRGVVRFDELATSDEFAALTNALRLA